ncbi:YlbL family protein [Aeromicrobium fastidiosum]|uniref:endopeptidase La n=1 Tax=Aeromicrobium fastidiosum TaxID=52699 RepID=A0A641AJV5_9ACTN|nr:PDZ domain-containing protein [Aeromicrobium fastidiosum]KAA1373044.1 PDZ domain-containing protein [Aeromicrobium fastidiosum]MBP2391024.1 PDZ domain-containing protein [Aeromicrobium fastidiosum]
MSDPTRLSRRYSTMVVATISLIVLTCVAYLIPVPYVTMRPGPAFDTLGKFDDQQMFTFGDGVKTYPTSGSLDFTTVSVTRADSKVSLVDAVTSWFDRDVAVVPKSLVYPDNQTAQQSTAASAAQLDGSKDASRVAALRAAGYTVAERPQVAGLTEGGAATDLLEVGDVITQVDGTAVATSEQAVGIIGAKKPGDVVSITVERKGATKTVDITTRPADDDPAVPRIGVSLGTKYTYPVKIDNNVGREIGGPSAGTMFALAIYDKLTPGELTGGKKIAGTGEITADGVVGPIGGVRQKMRGAANAGASIFLVPQANCDEATDGDDDGLKLVKITKLADAISSLEALATNPDAKVPACS